jgi:hypothetical protein
MAWTPPNPCSSYEVDLSISLYVPSPCASYEWGGTLEIYVINSATGTITWSLTTHEISGGQAQDLPTNLSPGQIRFPWSVGIKTETHLRVPWGSADVTDRPLDKFPWGFGDKSEVPIEINWAALGVNELPADKHYEIPWGTFTDLSDIHVDCLWYNILGFQDTHRKIPWAVLSVKLDNNVQSSFLSDTPVKDQFSKIPWGPLSSPGRSMDLGLERLNIVDKHMNVYWYRYPYANLFYQYYYAPPPCYPLEWTDSPLLNLNPCSATIDMFGTGPLQPFEHWRAGIRDQYLVLPPGSAVVFSKRYYYMQNTVLLKRIPDNTPIDASAISISTDINSWTWDFNITLMDSSYLDLLKPSVAGEDLVLQDLQITINNNVWICRIESWSETRVFGQRGWSVRGRSPSIELAAPYSLPFTYTNTSAKQGSQLIDDLLSGTGWSAEWGFDNNTSTYSDVIDPSSDWLVPANQFNLQEKTSMEGINEILAAIHASIITVPDCSSGNQRLIIIPRYRWTPWQWASQTVDSLLIRHYCHEIGSDYEHIPKYNFVIAAGDNHGVAVSATKDGTAGDKPAPMFTHPLITTQQAGHEAARNLLSRSGMWINNSLSLLSIDDGVTPTEEIPGLLLPGKLISLEDDSVTWRGVVTGVTINVKATTSRSGLEVEQLVNVERYYG